jgi:hypothetical protein
MSASIVYLLCALSSGLCAFILWREFRKTRVSLLFWSFLCFFFLTANNVVLIVDMLILGSDVSLGTYRGILSTAGFAVLIWGMIWDTT